MLEWLKEQVCEANLELVRRKIVIYTWGNVSAIDRENGLVVIKPSGVEYENMKPDDMVIVDLDGNVIEGHYKPSSDTETHLVLYKNFAQMGSIVHTHSTYAVAFAQAGMTIPALGTTHADFFYGDIPCTRALSEKEVTESYEMNTGKVIVECIGQSDPMNVPGIVVKNHGPFTWGYTPADAVSNAVVMEEIAKMDINTIFLNREASMPKYILDKHYYRKHGANAYYGQK